MAKLRKLAGDCDDVISCPAVYADDDIRIDGNDALAQGPQVTDPETLSQLNLGPGEVAVRLPRKLILDAARHLTEGT